MSDSVDRAIAEMEDSIQLPRQNGELVFESPWEARAFGIAVALSEAGQFPWRDFGSALASEIKHAEDVQEDSAYYERWVTAMRALLIEKGVLSEAEIEAKLADVRARHGAGQGEETGP